MQWLPLPELVRGRGLLEWRQLRAGELDHERLWLAVTIAAFVMGWVLVESGIPLPRCIWRDLTGLPCPGCGGTRCARAIAAGSLWTAFLMNPLLFAVFAAAAIYDLYAAIILAFRLPRLRFVEVPAWLGFWSRVGAASLFALNWAWLIGSKR